MHRLQQNPILADICQVPLFFVMSAHMTYDKETSLVLDSVTSFFRYVMACFYEHIHIRAGGVDSAMKGASATKHHKLDKVAFESLQGEDQHLVWSRDELVELIDEPLYNELVEIGILVEEHVVRIADEPGTSAADLFQRRKNVSFCHKLFCEWYAANYVAEHVNGLETISLKRFFANMDPFDLQYVYRIACGLNPVAADRIIQYLHSIEGGDKFAILCILEQTGQVDKIKETIRQMCGEGVIISGYDSFLLQGSSMQLLEIAARNEIPIEYVFLSDCLQSVDLSTAAIRTTSGLALTSRIPVKVLVVHLYNRDMTEDEAIDILQFASMCPSLCHLLYLNCVPPRSFNVGSTLSTLKSRNVTVCLCQEIVAEAEKYLVEEEDGHSLQHGCSGEEENCGHGQHQFRRSLAVGKRAKKLKAAVSLVDVTFTPESHLKEAPRLVVVDRKERVIPHLPTDSLNSKSELHRTDC
ncbi:hypothetical protein HOLleu_42399 [Holothuria leucospilota]|uniref:Uncharacterized protein n=1 Tax=Holothuria leucospilota TaxID=206669 RepID=A0A9Q0YAW6_HOLLE|nr:hypothetical protein HOLleu_42399 [Holothuria leucospilota]